MKKIYLIILLCLFLLVGCGNKKNYEINITLKVYYSTTFSL